MSPRSKVRQFCRRTDGVSIIEFAIVAPAFFLLVFAIVEYGLITFSQIAIESVAMQASRQTGIGAADGYGCHDRVCYVKNLVQEKTMGLINAQEVTVTANTIANGGAPEPDICLDDPAHPTSAPSTCKQWQEVNQIAYKAGALCPDGTNPSGGYCYEGNAGVVSLGNSSDLVEIRISYPWQVQIPFVKQFFGKNGLIMISSSTIVKNEPF